MKVYEVRNSANEFVMIAPLAIVAATFKLAKEAIARVEREDAPEAVPVKLFGVSRRTNWNWEFITVKSVGEQVL